MIKIEPVTIAYACKIDITPGEPHVAGIDFGEVAKVAKKYFPLEYRRYVLGEDIPGEI